MCVRMCAHAHTCAPARLCLVKVLDWGRRDNFGERGSSMSRPVIRALSHFQQQRLESSEGVNPVKM